MWSSSLSINTTDFSVLDTHELLNTLGKHKMNPYCTQWNKGIAKIKDEMSWNKTESQGEVVYLPLEGITFEGKEIFHLALHF